MDNIPNRVDTDYEEKLFSGVDKLRRATKDFVHMNKLTGYTVMNMVQMMSEAKGGRATSAEMREEIAGKWGADPVHPAKVCYDNLAKSILATLSSTTEDGGPPSKRTRWSATSEEDCRVCPKPYNFYNNRGGGRGGRGGTWRGRGGPRGRRGSGFF